MNANFARLPKKRCTRCGQLVSHYHYLVTNFGDWGRVCADDRACIKRQLARAERMPGIISERWLKEHGKK